MRVESQLIQWCLAILLVPVQKECGGKYTAIVGRWSSVVIVPQVECSLYECVERGKWGYCTVHPRHNKYNREARNRKMVSDRVRRNEVRTR
jgi:hypothetical protein